MKYLSTEYLSIFISSIALVVSILVALNSIRNEKRAKKLSLYDKRYRMFDAISNYVAAIITHPRTDDVHDSTYFLIDATHEFHLKTQEVDFLFDENINIFIKELIQKGGEYTHLYYEYRSMGDPEKKRDTLKDIYAVLTWFSKQREVSLKLMKKYLKLQD